MLKKIPEGTSHSHHCFFDVPPIDLLESFGLFVGLVSMTFQHPHWSVSMETVITARPVVVRVCFSVHWILSLVVAMLHNHTSFFACVGGRIEGDSRTKGIEAKQIALLRCPPFIVSSLVSSPL